MDAEPLFETRIDPPEAWPGLDLKSVWSYRELLFFLVWRDLKVRYKQTAFGIAWAVLQPLLAMVVFSVFFGKLARVPSDGVAYPLFAYTALVPWTYFANAVSSAANSVAAEERLITKVYFPRLLIPLGRVLGGLLDFGIALLILFAMMIPYRSGISVSLLALPGFTAICIVAATGIGLWTAALSVRYRDVRYTVPFLMQVLLFVTPVAYSTSLVPGAWRPLYSLNPMAGVIDGFRWSLLDAPAPTLSSIAISTAAGIALLASGAIYFRKSEDSFADII